jgi:hypothetical protein
MNRRILISVGLLFAIGCATNGASPDEAAAVAEVQLLSMAPAAGSQLTTDTVLVAEIKYAIRNYRPGVDYYVAPLFASAKGAGATFNMLDRIADAPRIAAAEATVTIRYPVARELASPDLVRPVRLWFFVMEGTGPGKTRVIGKTDELQFSAAAR